MGCAYYNGLYNARQLATDAHRAEREGRRGEAQSLWTQVAIKAESVVVRYPDSRYYDDALFMQGFALRQVEECGRAVVPLAVLVTVSDDTDLIAEGRLELAECWLTLGEPHTAREVLDPLTHLADSTVGSRRALLLGRASLLAGEPESALPDLVRSQETEARYQRAVTLLAMGRAREAASVIDSTRTEAYQEARWDAALTSIASVDHRIASALVDRLREDGDLTGGQEARLLIGDGQRWIATDPARARTRFLQAAEAAGDSVEAVLSIANLSVLEFRRANDITELPDFNETFAGIVEVGAATTGFVEPFASVTGSAAVQLVDGDPLRLFRDAEVMRDQLGARSMAAATFAHIARSHPSSVLAPKALLAMSDLRPESADSVRRVLWEQYRNSPYTQVVFGLEAPRYTHVEDSLRLILSGNRPQRRFRD